MIGQKGFFYIMLLTTTVSFELLCFVPLVKAAGTLTQNPVADSYIYRDKSDVNYGSSSYLKVWKWSDKLQYRAFLKFDLTSIPSSAIVASAKLELYLLYRTGEATSRISVHYCSDNTWTELGITWNNAPSFESTATYTNTTIAFEEAWYSWMVTEAVNRARPNQQVSLVIVSTSETIDNFVSKEPEYWFEYTPRLIVTYTLADSTPPQILSITQEPQADNVESLQNVKVMVNVADDITGVSEVILCHAINNESAWSNTTMIYNSASKLYETTIQGYPLNTLVTYKIVAYDNAGNCKVEDRSGQYYVYTVVPEVSSAAILLLFMIMCSMTIILAKKRLRAKPRNV